jgi:hypothetical protein
MTDQPEKPKTFNMHWGSGIIAEEAIHDGEHHRPTIQLMEFDDGSLSIRFCHYSHNGRFQRSPLIVGESEIDGLRRGTRQHSSPQRTANPPDILKILVYSHFPNINRAISI